jgi:ATP-binding cassette, subfamily B (MDR/TAP), member 1
MSLVFGNLTEQFVVFGTILNEVQEGVPGAAELVPAAAANFRRVAAKDAGYLALIGELSRSSTPSPI